MGATKSWLDIESIGPSGQDGIDRKDGGCMLALKLLSWYACALLG